MGPRIDFLVRRLSEEGKALGAQLAAVQPDEWAMRVYPPGDSNGGAQGAWQMRDILAHLVSAEAYIRLMIAYIAQGGPGAPRGIDIDAVNASEVAALSGLPPGELIERLRLSRSESIALVARLDEDDLDRRGNHPLLGEMPLEDFVKLIYRHDKMHMRDAQRAATHERP